MSQDIHFLAVQQVCKRFLVLLILGMNFFLKGARRAPFKKKFIPRSTNARFFSQPASRFFNSVIRQFINFNIRLFSTNFFDLPNYKD